MTNINPFRDDLTRTEREKPPPSDMGRAGILQRKSSGEVR